jgi:hypothetical protein
MRILTRKRVMTASGSTYCYKKLGLRFLNVKADDVIPLQLYRDLLERLHHGLVIQGHTMPAT